MANEQHDHQRNGLPQTDGAIRQGQGSGRLPDDRSSGKKGGVGKFVLIALGLFIVLAILAAIGIFGAVSQHRERDKTTQSISAGAITVRVAKPTKSPPVFDFSLPGSSEPLTTATLYARVNGYLKARYVDIGDRVEAGQLLAEIDAPDLDAQLNASRAQLDQTRAALGIAKVTFEREQRLLEQKVVSKQEYDQSEAAFHQAQANVRTAEANVQNLSVQQGFEKITAPFTGIVTTRFLDDGALIASGSATTTPSIYTLSQTDILRVFIYVPQAYAPNVQTGQEIEVSAPEYPQKIFEGKVTRTADSLDPTARTERVEIQLPSQQGRLLPGMYLTIRFKVQQAEPALIVPANTVIVRKDGTQIAVVDSEQKVHYRDVKLGRDFGKTIEIASGLQGSETLVVNPTTDLIEGEKIEVAQEEKKGA